MDLPEWQKFLLRQKAEHDAHAPLLQTLQDGLSDLATGPADPKLAAADAAFTQFIEARKAIK